MSCIILNMFYSVLFLCLFIFSGTAVSKNKKVFYISGYNTSKVKYENETTVLYQYENNEVLNLSCHIEIKQPLFWLTWLQNEQTIPGKNNRLTKTELQLNITKSNDNDSLECYAFEDGIFSEDEKKITKKITLILKYIGHEDTTSRTKSTAADALERNEKKPINNKTNEDSIFQKLLKSKLFWTVVVVFIVIIILACIVVFATMETKRVKEDQVILHPAVSNISVCTTESRTPILPYDEIPEEHVYTNDRRTDKVGLNLAVSHASYSNTESRKPIPHKNTEVFYINDTYKKNNTQSYGSREMTDSCYQEPMDSQAYCEPQLYSEPESQFYVEPVPKKLRMKNAPNVNYNSSNKNNGSPFITNENVDLYQNSGYACGDEFNYYTLTS